MTKALIPHNNSLPLAVGNLDHYIRAAHAVPMLSEEEERHLALRLRDHEDVEAAQRLILSHLRFVVRIARDYLGYGLALGDLIQEIYEYILRNWRIVKVATTKAQRKLFFNLHRMKKRLGWFSRAQLEDVAGTLGVKPEEVEEMEARLAARDQLFDAQSLTDEDDDERRHPHGYLADERFEPSALVAADHDGSLQEQALRRGLEALDERSRDIVQRRWLNDSTATLHELAAEYGVSAERIRQIEAAAFKKLRKGLEERL